MEDSDEELVSSTFNQGLKSRAQKSARNRGEQLTKRRADLSSSRHQRASELPSDDSMEWDMPHRRETSWLDADPEDTGKKYDRRPQSVKSKRPTTSQMHSTFLSLSDPEDSEEELSNVSATGVFVQSDQGRNAAESERHPVEKMQLGLPSLEGLDLSVLIKRLIPVSELREEDKQWTWDNLISSVASKLPLEVGLDDHRQHDTSADIIIFR